MNQKIIEEFEEMKKQSQVSEIQKRRMLKRIEYIYNTYKECGLPILISEERFKTGQRIGTWLYNQIDKIRKLANEGNDVAQWIIEEMNKRQQLTAVEKKIY